MTNPELRGHDATPRRRRLRRDRPRATDPMFVEAWQLRRLVRKDASALRVDDALHRHRNRPNRSEHLAWLDLLAEALDADLAGDEFEGLLNEWRRRRAGFVGAGGRRNADRIFPRVTSLPARRRWPRRAAVPAT